MATPNLIGSASTKTKTVTKSVIAGNLLIVGFAGGDGTNTPTISDGVNSWTLCTGSPTKDATNGASATLWWAIAATSASITVTITFAAGTFNGTTLIEFSNVSATPADSGAGAANIAGSTSTDAMKTGSFTTTGDGDLVVTLINDDGNTHTTTQYNAGTGWTKVALASQDPAGASDTTYAFAYQIQSVHGAINPQWTELAADSAVGVGAAFKASAGGGGGTFVTLVGGPGGMAGMALAGRGGLA